MAIILVFHSIKWFFHSTGLVGLAISLLFKTKLKADDTVAGFTLTGRKEGFYISDICGCPSVAAHHTRYS